jgi:putative sigma-54 modulation protein
LDNNFELVLRNVPRTEGLEQKIEEKVAKLEAICDRISHCRVIIEAPERGRRKGSSFKVAVELRLPGTELVANRESESQSDNETLTPAIREAFDAIRRQLKDHVGKKRKRPQKALDQED